MKKKSRAQRQDELVEMLKDDPFYTDEELSNLFNVSIQTIRLDRLALGIPELRERVKKIAETETSKVKTLGIKEITGEIIDLSVGHVGISILDVTRDMIYSKTETLKDEYIFSMAKSLAMAILNIPKAVMICANIEMLKQINKEDRLIAKAEIYKNEKEKHYVEVLINNKVQEKVFKGKFVFEELV